MRGILFKLKVWFLRMILGENYVLVLLSTYADGTIWDAMCCSTDDDETEDCLTDSIGLACAEREGFKNIILGGALKYLSRYEIDCKNFIQKLDPNYGKER